MLPKEKQPPRHLAGGRAHGTASRSAPRTRTDAGIQRRGYEPVKELFAEVAVPVAEEETAGAFLGDRGG